jgi:hypothetical protein
LQCNDRVCIEAGAHHSVHLCRHGTDDGVSDASGLENPGDAGHQQRRLAGRAGSHFATPHHAVQQERPVCRSLSTVEPWLKLDPGC